MTESTPAGWYPDPENSGQQRYWDGNAWTDNRAPGSAPVAPAAPAAKKPIYKRTWFIVVAALIGLGVVANMVSGGPSTTPESAPSAIESTSPASAEKPKPAVTEPEPEPVEEPAEPEMTMGQKQAVQSAERYVDMGGFSRKKLIDQLAYEGFSKADAEFAVNYIKPDWNAQAAQSAKSYVEMGGFSRQKLLEQLAYEGFSQAEAEFGVKAAGY